MKASKLVLAVALFGLFLGAASPSAAAEAFFREVGMSLYANQDLDVDAGEVKSVGLAVAWAGPLKQGEATRLDLRLELQQGFFSGLQRGVEIATAPSLRFYFNWLGMRPFLEAGAGLSYVSLDIHELGTNFNFLTFAGLGVGVPLGEAARLDLGYRLRHLSNAGLDEYNHGLTSNQVQLTLRWDF